MSTARFSLSTPVLLYSKCRLEAPPPCAKGYRDSGASTPRVRSRTRTSRTGIRSCFPRKLFCRHVRSPKRWSRRRLSFRRARHRTLRREIRIAEGNLQIKDDREKRIPPSCWIVQMRKGVWHNIPLRTSGVAKFALHNFSETEFRTASRSCEGRAGNAIQTLRSESESAAELNKRNRRAILRASSALYRRYRLSAAEFESSSKTYAVIDFSS